MIHIKKQHDLELIHRLRTDILALRQRRVQEQSALLQHKDKLLKDLEHVNERVVILNNEIEQEGNRKDRTYNDQLQRLGGSAQQFTTLLERANQDNHQLQEELRLKDDELKEFVSQLVKISDEANHRVNELTELRKRVETVKKRSEQIRNKQQLHRSQRAAAQQQIVFFQQLSQKHQKDKAFISEQLERIRQQNRGLREQLNQRAQAKGQEGQEGQEKDLDGLEIQIVLLARRHADTRKDIEEHKQRIVQEEARNHQKEEYLRRLKEKLAVLTQDCQDEQHQADSLRKQIQSSEERRKRNREELLELLERVERQERQNQRLKQLLEQNYRASQQAKELLLQREGSRNEAQIPRQYIRKGYHL